MLDLKEIQKRLWDWQMFHYGRPANLDLLMALGMGEEVGEVQHAVLKGNQKKRMDGVNLDLVADGIGDVIVYACQLASTYGLDMEDIIVKVSEEVLNRDDAKRKITVASKGDLSRIVEEKGKEEAVAKETCPVCKPDSCPGTCSVFSR